MLHFPRMCESIILNELAQNRMHFSQVWLQLVVVAIISHINNCDGHGRLIEPPSRASAWRYGFQTPPDYNDHELYCGGFTRQWRRNGGKCGECGDPWDIPEPRPHENGGLWGQGVIVRKYAPGSEITIRVELTASHMGYFEFRLCPEPNAKQECLDKNVLNVLGGSPWQPAPTDLDGRFYPRNGSRIYEIKSKLPDLECSQCVLQWRYVAGNNWGICPDGNGAVGCGPQEEFRSCSDIALGEGAHTPIRPPVRPTYRTTAGPKTKHTSTETTQLEDSSEAFNYVPILIIGIILLLVLCGLAVWYLYKYHNQNVKAWVESAGVRICREQLKSSTVTATSSTKSPDLLTATAPTTEYATEKSVEDKNSLFGQQPPVPPPRTKRNSRVKEMSPNDVA